MARQRTCLLGVLALAFGVLAAGSAWAMPMAVAGPDTPTPTGYYLDSFGSNDSDQLGQGTASGCDATLTPGPVVLPSGDEVSGAAGSIAGNSAGAIAITTSGGLIGWGSNADGQLGLPLGQTVSASPTALSLPDSVTATAVAAAGSSDGYGACTRRDYGGVSLALGSDGQVYGTGDNYDGALGALTTGQSGDAADRQAGFIPISLRARAPPTWMASPPRRRPRRP